MRGIIKKLFCLFAISSISTSVFAGDSLSAAYGFYQQGVKSEESLYAFEARTAFQKAVTLDPKNPNYLSRYSWFLHLYGFTEEAIGAFHRALANPKKGEANVYTGLAWDEFFMGDMARATHDFQYLYSSRWLKSNYTNATTAVGTLADRELKIKIKKLKQKLEHDPNNFSEQRELFNAYIYHNEYRSAVKVGRVLMANSNVDNFSRLKFARALFKIKEYHEAAIQYHELMQRFPRNAFLAYEWGTKLVELEEYHAAYGMFTQSLDYYPTAEAKIALAKLAARNGHCDAALNLLSGISDKHSIAYLVGKGDVYHECHQYQQANLYYQDVLQQCPYNSDALWGVISSTAADHRYAGNRVAYDRWQEVYYWTRPLLQSQLVHYYQSPMIPLNGAYYDNSISFSRLDLGTAYDFYAGANTRLNFAYNYSKFAQDGFNDVSRHMLQLQAAKLFSEHWQVMGGVSDKQYSNHNNNVNGNVSLRYTWSESHDWLRNLQVTLTYDHFDIIDTQPPFGIQVYNYNVSIGAVGLNIRTNDYIGTIYYQATRRLALWAQGIYGDYSDGNVKKSGSFEASYQIFDVPQVKIIYDYFYLNFANPAPVFIQNNNSQSAYYDPISLQIHMGKIRVEHFFTKNLHIGLEGGVSFFPQNSSFGEIVTGYLDYNIRSQLTMRLAGQYFTQAHSVNRNNLLGNSFWAKGITLSLIYKL